MTGRLIDKDRDRESERGGFLSKREEERKGENVDEREGWMGNCGERERL